MSQEKLDREWEQDAPSMWALQAMFVRLKVECLIEGRKIADLKAKPRYYQIKSALVSSDVPVPLITKARQEVKGWINELREDNKAIQQTSFKPEANTQNEEPLRLSKSSSSQKLSGTPKTQRSRFFEGAVSTGIITGCGMLFGGAILAALVAGPAGWIILGLGVFILIATIVVGSCCEPKSKTTSLAFN